MNSKAHYNCAYITLLKKDTANAITLFDEIINSDYNELDRGGTGSGLMGEPYALYKNNSSKMLAQIYLAKHDYKKALKNTVLADKEYPYRHFCGNEYEANRIFIATLYASCYKGMDKTDEAINVLFPLCIESGLADNESLVEMLSSLLKEKYSDEKIKNEIEIALNAVRPKTPDQKPGYSEIYITDFFSHTVELTTYMYSGEYKKAKNLKGQELFKYYFSESKLVKYLSKSR